MNKFIVLLAALACLLAGAQAKRIKVSAFHYPFANREVVLHLDDETDTIKDVGMRFCNWLEVDASQMRVKHTLGWNYDLSKKLKDAGVKDGSRLGVSF